jgi:hypothetical protein
MPNECPVLGGGKLEAIDRYWVRFQNVRFELDRWPDPSINPSKINTRIQTQTPLDQFTSSKAACSKPGFATVLTERLVPSMLLRTSNNSGSRSRQQGFF